ncbi:MAG: hypothetical protein HKN12_04815 [Gemmatimonadetes bacterium]|nr:hypothetical protein [Gemmatimonadota bacterium]
MSLAEVFLRIGGGFGAWLIVAAYGLVLAAVPSVAGDTTTGEPFRGTFIFGVFVAAASPLLLLGRPWSGRFRWIAGVVAALLVWDLTVVVPYIQVTLTGLSPFAVHAGTAIAGADLPAATLGQKLWAPLHLAVLLFAVGTAVLYWRPRAEPAHD